MDHWQMDGWTDRQMEVQHETIIPRHYCVVRYKNTQMSRLIWDYPGHTEGTLSHTVVYKAFCPEEPFSHGTVKC